jgi:MSHA biogenesis protein MshQ
MNTLLANMKVLGFALILPFLLPTAAAADSCFTDDFNRANGNPGADWTVSSSSGGFGNPVINNTRLRLTDASGNVATKATLNLVFPGSGNVLTVIFDHFAYGGSGADGIAVVLSDSTILPVAGAYGGSLGYAQKNIAGGGGADLPGFTGGWIGVGIDEFGNFSSPTEGRVGGPGVRIDSVSIRGSGTGFASGANNYRYHVGTNTLAPQVDNNNAAPFDRYRIIIDHSNGVNALVSVERDATSGAGTAYVTLIAAYDAKAQAGQAVLPTGLWLSFTGSTGGSSNIHEIDNLSVCTPVGSQRMIRWREVVQ